MFAMDSAQKSGFHIDDDGRVFLNGHPYKVPLELCDDGVARPTLDRKKILGPNGAIEPDEEETTERTELDAAFFDASQHRPHFGFRDKAAEDRLAAIYTTVDAMSEEQYRHGGGSSADTSEPVQHTDATSVEDAREAAYAEYDDFSQNAWKAGK